MIKQITSSIPINECHGSMQTGNVFCDIYRRMLYDKEVLFQPIIYDNRLCMLNLKNNSIWTPQGIQLWVKIGAR